MSNCAIATNDVYAIQAQTSMPFIQSVFIIKYISSGWIALKIENKTYYQIVIRLGQVRNTNSQSAGNVASAKKKTISSTQTPSNR